MVKRTFNINGPCVPALHYMVDTSAKIDKIISDYIDKGEYFTINRARQYGKTTTLEMLYQRLKEQYIVIDLSFEGKEDYFSSLDTFSSGLCSDIRDILHLQSYTKQAAIFDESIDNKLPLRDLGKRFTELCRMADKKVILTVDEVDKASDNQVFLSFLGMLRDQYISRNKRSLPTFYSVILVGVHDIKNLKIKLRPEEKHSYNSPWNIAAAFDLDMSFSAFEIATMLEEYESDYHTGMDIGAVAEQIHYYTSGYPFLVSDLCKTIHDDSLEWSADGVNEAEKRVVKEKNTLFDDVTKNLINNPKFSDLVKRILLQGAHITFEDQNPEIDMGVMYGIFDKDSNNLVKVSNIIFETRIYNYFISVEATNGNFDNVASEKSVFIQQGHLNVTTVLNRFSQFMYSEYRDENSEFLERQAGLLFLCYLKPIINGTGHYVVEPETRGSRRMDIVVFYDKEEHIIELKIWRGEQYEQDGLNQLARYMAFRGRKHGYLLSFCDNVKAPRKGGVVQVGDCEITEVIVAYRDKA